MTSPYLLGFEVLQILILLLMLRHALIARDGSIPRLLVGSLFGLAIEIIAIYQTGAYQYGAFSLKVLGVPIAIGVAWGNQLYGARLLSDSTSLPVWLRPVAEALLVIYVDLLVEPVATRLGMWHFGFPAEFEWFGTPYGNFWGFFWLVVSFGTSSRLLETLPSGPRRTALAPFAILGGLLAAQTLNATAYYLLPHQQRNWATAGLLVLGAVAVCAYRPRQSQRVAGAGWLFIVLSLAYFFGIGLLSGALSQPPRLLLVTTLVTALGFAAVLRWRSRAQDDLLRSGPN